MDAPIPVLLGQTASGKTSVGIHLAKLLDGEIISVDSRKVYRGLPIGTATPAGVWKGEAYVVEGVPHYLMGHLSPDQIYTAGDFATDAETLIEKILKRGKRPILVGGTGFYFKALQKGLPKLPPRDEELRQSLQKKGETGGFDALHQELAAVDPVAAKNISVKDRHKIIRALEVRELTGQPFSSWKDVERHPSARKFAVLGLKWPKAVLETRIEQRSKKMWEEGMIQEAARVLSAGHAKTCAALASFGYREAVQVLEKEIPESEFLPRLIKGTKAYAKRQQTWFRTQIAPAWFDVNDSSSKEEIALKMRDFIQTPK
jgi:tRNA dimethylallyltransferase